MCRCDDSGSYVNNNVVKCDVVEDDVNLPKMAILEMQMVNVMGEMVNNEHILPVMMDKYSRQERLLSVTNKSIL